MRLNRPPNIGSLGLRSRAAAAISVLVLVLAAAGGTALARTQGPPPPNPLPTITGTAAVGQRLTGTPGTWGAGITPTDQWLRCNAAGAACTPVSGATGLSYVPVSADVGGTLRLEDDGSAFGFHRRR